MLNGDSSSPGVSNCYVYKSRLQEYAQKVGLPTPLYETTKEGPSHEPSFRSTVILDDIRYDSLPGFFNRKAAEQSAAEVALMMLANSGEVKCCISQPVHETGLCKNLLQEYAQKKNYAIPLYVFQRDETPGRVPHFKCTVEIGGIKYIGAAAKTKKEAEIKAARTALLALQSSSSGSSDGPNHSQLTVIPCKKRGADATDVHEENANVPKAKKPRVKKKMPKKKQKRRERANHTQGEYATNLKSVPKFESETGQVGAYPIQRAGSGLLELWVMRNSQDGPIVEPGVKEMFGVKGSLPSFADNSKSGQPVLDDFNQTNQETPVQVFTKSNGDHQAAESSEKEASLVQGSLCHCSAGNSKGERLDASQGNQETPVEISNESNKVTSKMIGVGEVNSMVSNSTLAHIETSNITSSLNTFGERIEAGTSQG